MTSSRTLGISTYFHAACSNSGPDLTKKRSLHIPLFPVKMQMMILDQLTLAVEVDGEESIKERIPMSKGVGDPG